MGYGKPASELHAMQAAKPPQPPADLANLFSKETRVIFDAYAKSRPYNKWDTSDLRLLSQAALLEQIILKALDQVATEGLTQVSATGTTKEHPAIGAMVKSQTQQQAIFRRLGISILGTEQKGQARTLKSEAHQIHHTPSDNGLLA